MTPTPDDKMITGIVDALWDRLRPAVTALLERRILDLATSAATGWVLGDRLREEIDRRTTEMVNKTFAPALDELARRRARSLVAKRARKAGVEPAMLPGMSDEDQP
jgi:hypothetical protein